MVVVVVVVVNVVAVVVVVVVVVIVAILQHSATAVGRIHISSIVRSVGFR